MKQHPLRAFRLAFLAGSLIALGGCLALNAAVGVGSLLVPGPLQFAGTFYSVANYTFQYAVNSKTPLEVVEDDFRQLNDFLNPDAPLANGTLTSPLLTLAWQGQERIRMRPMIRTTPKYHFENPTGLPAWGASARWKRIMVRKHARQRLMALHFRSGVRQRTLPLGTTMIAQR